MMRAFLFASAFLSIVAVPALADFQALVPSGYMDNENNSFQALWPAGVMLNETGGAATGHPRIIQ